MGGNFMKEFGVQLSYYLKYIKSGALMVLQLVRDPKSDIHCVESKTYTPTVFPMTLHALIQD
jgi:hypothetical protein